MSAESKEPGSLSFTLSHCTINYYYLKQKFTDFSNITANLLRSCPIHTHKRRRQKEQWVNNSSYSARISRNSSSSTHTVILIVIL